MVLSALVKQGFEVLMPFGGGQPYDLVVDLGDRHFLRVQCKRAWPLRGCLVFNCRATDHGRGPQSYAGLADIFGVYFPQNDQVYLVPLDAIAAFEGRLRFEQPLNNQRRGIRFAQDYEIGRWDRQSLRERLGRLPLAPEREPDFA
jgi:hypothetical protein